MRLGIVDVPGWLASLPARALDAWWAYYQLEPWDVPREHWPDVQRTTKRRKKRLNMVNPDAGLQRLKTLWGL